MAKEGFRFELERYRAVLKLMDEVGMGKLVTDSKNRVQGLKDIPVTLPSLSAAVLGSQNGGLKASTPHRVRNRMVPTPRVVPKRLEQPPTRAKRTPGVTVSGVILTFGSGKTANISLPKDFTKEELTDLIERISAIGRHQ